MKENSSFGIFLKNSFFFFFFFFFFIFFFFFFVNCTQFATNICLHLCLFHFSQRCVCMCVYEYLRQYFVSFYLCSKTSRLTQLLLVLMTDGKIKHIHYILLKYFLIFIFILKNFFSRFLSKKFIYSLSNFPTLNFLKFILNFLFC